jgi:integrase
MPRKSNPLTAGQIKQLKPTHAKRPTVYQVGGVDGLHIQVTPNGAKSWFLRATVAGKRREIGLGPYPELLLGDALDAAREARQMIRDGIDPVERRRERKQALYEQQLFHKTFVQILDEFLAKKLPELSSEKNKKQWASPIKRYALPVIGSKIGKEISGKDIYDILAPIWTKKAPTAKKLKQKLMEVFEYADAKGYLKIGNRAAFELKIKNELPKMSSVLDEKHQPALQQKDIQRFWAALQKREGMGAEALRFQMMTATRPGGVRFMTWDELDLENKLWTVQPGRQAAKINKREAAKKVPLSDEAVAILKRIHPLHGSPYVFWAPMGGALSDGTMAQLMKKMHAADVKAGGEGYLDAQTGKIAVPHGNRSSFTVWATETGHYEWQLAMAAIWHKMGTAHDLAYQRSDLVERRREMMTEWSRFVTDKQAAALPA